MKDLNTEQYITLIGEISIGSGSPTPINNQQKTVDASTETVIVRPDTGYTGLSRVTVSAVTSEIDANIKPENIKYGVTILGVTGTYKPDHEEEYIPRYEDNMLIFDTGGGDAEPIVTNNTLEFFAESTARVEGEELIF